MDTLNLPPFDYKIKKSGANSLIFDELRKKYVVLTPEEWVRQHFLHYLIQALHYPKGLISVERGTTYNRLQKRTDLCVYDHHGKPHLLVECKAAHIPITQEVVKQVSVYNQTLQAKYVVITNGLQHFCWHVDFSAQQYHPLQEVPAFKP
ncbi:type I restriction enzyme HsdR N-terminal domain-containing protein [Pontibacter silvestris]|uniref:Type I restriction enzyme HsdR N-terminal domain-containing protein n=1 Tax=Pontibacter silvestris TaxID=2305183 RepID=A0ABW4X047_9BACT|nr:type I restriction enzyme HsdR N-terminal domain-containing protein [Pontibacter silvestris]MCC9135929.1 type I restriction enzyme HsdR N-terminal domain-containing protein [Pontibacter silvestris]